MSVVVQALTTLVVAIDVTVAGWEPHGKTTTERLHQLADRHWRPQDCDLLDSHSAVVQQWVRKAAELLNDALRVHLSAPCPSCGAGWDVSQEQHG